MSNLLTALCLLGTSFRRTLEATALLLPCDQTCLSLKTEIGGLGWTLPFQISYDLTDSIWREGCLSVLLHRETKGCWVLLLWQKPKESNEKE